MSSQFGQQFASAFLPSVDADFGIPAVYTDANNKPPGIATTIQFEPESTTLQFNQSNSVNVLSAFIKVSVANLSVKPAASGRFTVTNSLGNPVTYTVDAVPNSPVNGQWLLRNCKFSGPASIMARRANP